MRPDQVGVDHLGVLDAVPRSTYGVEADDRGGLLAAGDDRLHGAVADRVEAGLQAGSGAGRDVVADLGGRRGRPCRRSPRRRRPSACRPCASRSRRRRTGRRPRPALRARGPARRRRARPSSRRRPARARRRRARASRRSRPGWRCPGRRARGRRRCRARRTAGAWPAARPSVRQGVTASSAAARRLVVRLAGEQPGRVVAVEPLDASGSTASRAEDASGGVHVDPGEVDLRRRTTPGRAPPASVGGARASGSRPSRGPSTRPAAPVVRQKRSTRSRASARRGAVDEVEAGQHQPGGGGVHVRVDERGGDERAVELDDLVGAVPWAAASSSEPTHTTRVAARRAARSPPRSSGDVRTASVAEQAASWPRRQCAARRLSNRARTPGSSRSR